MDWEQGRAVKTALMSTAEQSLVISRSLLLTGNTALAKGAVDMVICVGNIQIALVIDRSFRNREFLFSYLSKFRSSNTSQPHLHLVLQRAPDEFASPEHALWNEPTPRNETLSQLWVHRDFVAKEFNEKIVAVLPDFSEAMMDGVDNAINVAMNSIMSLHQQFLFHCATVVVAGQAYVFYGPSGIGKSTLAKLCFDLQMEVMSSDQAFLTWSPNGHFLVHGSCTTNPDIPRGSSRWLVAPHPVKAFVALVRRSGFEISQQNSMAALPGFLNEVLTIPDKDQEVGFYQEITRAALHSSAKFLTMNYPSGFNFWPELLQVCEYE